MFMRLNLLLLLLCCFINNGIDPKSVSGIKGGSVTLTCEYDKKIWEIDLRSETEKIGVCDTEEECSGRVFKKRSCDVIIKDLSFSDAGKYILRVYFTNDQKESENRTYQLHIHDEISVKIGKPLKLGVLFSNAYKVETNSSGEWTEVWTRGHGVSSDRLTDSDENLIIKSFFATDAGTYRVLGFKNETLIKITVTVTESSLGLKEYQNSTDNPSPPPPTVGNCTLSDGVCLGFLVALVVLGVLVVALVLAQIISAVKKCQSRHRNNQEDIGNREGTPLQGQGAQD